MGAERAGRVLVVDDDPDVRMLASGALREAGFAVSELPDGRQVLDLLGMDDLVAVVLDLGLPDCNGLDLLRDIRSRSAVPLIVLTARGGEADRVTGLELGADDYVVKPFFPRELVARIRSVTRRAGGADGANVDAAIDHDGLHIDRVAHEVTLDGDVLELTAKEYDLLVHLAAHPRQVFSREQLLDQVWGSATEWQSPATVNEHVYRLRQKLAEGEHHWIVTVRGAGYRFDP